MIVIGLIVVGFILLEKCFKFSSKESGMIIVVNDVFVFFLIIFISYFGGYRNKVWWFGIGVMVMSFGCLLFVLFYFFVGKYILLEF